MLATLTTTLLLLAPAPSTTPSAPALYGHPLAKSLVQVVDTLRNTTAPVGGLTLDGVLFSPGLNLSNPAPHLPPALASGRLLAELGIESVTVTGLRGEREQAPSGGELHAITLDLELRVQAPQSGALAADLLGVLLDQHPGHSVTLQPKAQPGAVDGTWVLQGLRLETAVPAAGATESTSAASTPVDADAVVMFLRRSTQERAVSLASPDLAISTARNAGSGRRFELKTSLPRTGTARSLQFYNLLQVATSKGPKLELGSVSILLEEGGDWAAEATFLAN